MAVTDVKKLRPELLEISDAEFERRAVEFEMARQERQRIADIKAKEELAAEAARQVEAVLAGVKWLHDQGLLPDRVTAGFSRGDIFSPGSILKAPTAESLAGGPRKASASGEKKFRRRKDPVTGEYVPSKAAQKAGVA
ncbi:hypothetical protein FJ959_08720 [Mesorhizobium sp. B2-2-4]|uniref:hypothetical protein n=1 Tax=Mesorhizobium sp. B2-2-4 TaxID=2589962 RepID=UPI00112E7597|nr:hypothetical protein [Mesorhizobium sp. B2-2-4]TPM58949.1 hypothetical protein FJ959_08720 [Mesorhizobium sp. B2-2-4]